MKTEMHFLYKLHRSLPFDCEVISFHNAVSKMYYIPNT